VVPGVFGGDFSGAVLPFIWLLPGTIALAGSKILSAYVFSRGKPMVNAWIALVTLVVTVVADLLLIPGFGVSGAAVAASCAYIVSLALTARAYRQISGASIAGVLLPRPADLPIAIEAARGMAGRLAGGQ
jgi:O-antigen/teichoic acid export membrane protein